MSDNEQNDIPPQDASDADDLDSLSDEEKAAFEKIMAEISVATSETTESSETAPSADRTPDSPPKEEQEGESSQIAPSSAEPNKPEKGPITDQASENEEELDEDQQDALNKIMAEIDSKRKGETEEPPPEPESEKENEEEDEDLSEDQQDVLNQIMSEINSKRETDEVKEEEKAQENTPEESEPEESDEDALPEDQQAALDSIMADIASKKQARDVSTAGEIDPGPDAPDDPDDQPDKKQYEEDEQDLSIEEFSSELDSLLSTSPDTTTKQDKIEDQPDSNGQDGSTVETVAENETDTPTETVKDSENDHQKDQEFELHEIEVDTDDMQKSGKKDKSRKNTNGRIGLKITRWAVRISIILLVPICLFTMAIGGYFGFQKIGQWQANETPLPTDLFSSKDGSSSQDNALSPPVLSQQNISDVEASGEILTDNPRIKLTDDEIVIPDTSGAWRDDLLGAQREIQSKILEIQSLKEYYNTGINQDIAKIASELSQAALTLEKAMTDKNNELRVRSVQRRINYIAKLEVPLLELGAMSENIRYLERRCQLHDTLSKGISGLPKKELQQQVALSLKDCHRYSEQLSIDYIQTNETDLDGTWKLIESRIRETSDRKTQNSPKNKAISKEICNGNYDRKFMLTDLSENTAQCLVKWSGKDLYLNGLTELRPEVAKTLAQWPGEWLSLNGLKTLSSQSASYLAQWSGKRLSLNGLTTLSPTATKNLSGWQGEQLELVGLQSIGPWENYKTKLFLSESLRRRLDLQ